MAIKNISEDLAIAETAAKHAAWAIKEGESIGSWNKRCNLEEHKRNELKALLGRFI